MQLVNTTQEIQQIASTLKDYFYKNPEKAQIAYDTEFIRETTFYPKLEILQIAGAEQVWIIDAQAFNKTQLKPLLEIFLDPGVLKIVHAAHGDQECMWAAYDHLPTPLFDTAIGASLLGFGENVGLSKLLKQTVGVDLMKGYTRTNWSKRPLPDEILQYAALDVQYLVEVKEYLFKKLEKENRVDWALKLSSKYSDERVYDVPPEELTKKIAHSGKFNLKDYGVLLELVRWREARVRELNVPRRWLADDGVLLDLAKIKPKTEEQLKSFRGLSKSEHKKPYCDRILTVIQKAVEADIEIPASIRAKHAQPTLEESRSLELLKVYLGMLSEEIGIASKYLIQSNDLLALLRLRPQTLEELRKSEMVSAHVQNQKLNELYHFLKGDLLLGLSAQGIRSILQSKEQPEL